MYRNEILMYLRRNNKTRSEISIDEPQTLIGMAMNYFYQMYWELKMMCTWSLEDEIERELLL